MADPKNIVICCDGTGNKFVEIGPTGRISPSEANSNVVKLYTALIINNDQVGYYHPGVGTMGASQVRTLLGKQLSVLNGLAFARGFMENVEDAYRYLMQTYNDGDRIFLFGFSRGSYTVRALAAVLHAYGLLCKGNEGHIPYLFQRFKDDMNGTRKENRRRRQKKHAPTMTSLAVHDAFKQTFSHAVTLHFVGLWDTVSSVGWISQPMRLLDSAQNPIIQTGRHAVSLDERRCYYQSNLWGEALPLSETPTLNAPQDILQVWFAGVHSDVGGSYPQLESALSNIALRWLLDQAIAHGLQVHPDRERLIFGLPPLDPTQPSYAAAELYVTPPSPGIVHPSLHGLGWWALELLPHKHYLTDIDKERWRIPLGAPRTLPRHSVIHPSVVERLHNHSAGYAPPNLPPSTLHPHPGHQPGTTADLTGYYRYLPERKK